MDTENVRIFSSSPERYASVYGSPGSRVRFIGFFSIYSPFLLVVFVAGWLLSCAIPIEMSPVVAVILFFALIGVAWIAFNSAGERFEAFLKGARGEEIVARELALLPGGWDVFHGIARSGMEGVAGSGDFDHIVVGSDSMFIVETKNWEAPVTLERGVLKVLGRSPRRSPVAQVRKAGLDLANILKEVMPDGIAVTPIVCFASNGLTADRENVDDVCICNVRVLRKAIQESPKTPIDENKRQLILDILVKRMSF